MLVLALAASLVAPVIGRSTEALTTRAAVAGVSALLRQAREQAAVTRRPHEVRVGQAEGLLLLTASGASRPLATCRLPAGLRILSDTPGGLTVRFTPQGLATAASLRLLDRQRHLWRVTVDPLTGRVSARRDEG
jgi:hypothetical protein